MNITVITTIIIVIIVIIIIIISHDIAILGKTTLLSLLRGHADYATITGI